MKISDEPYLCFLTDSLVLQSELEIAMRLVGITELSQAHPGLVNTKDIDHLMMATNSEGRRLVKL